MSIEDLKKAVAEAKEADLFATSPTDRDEPVTDLTEEEELPYFSCRDCFFYDYDINDCSLIHCCYGHDSDYDLEGQQYLY